MRSLRTPVARALLSLLIALSWGASGVEASLPDTCPASELAAVGTCDAERAVPDAAAAAGAHAHQSCHCEHSHQVGVPVWSPARSSLYTSPAQALPLAPPFAGRTLAPPVPPPLS
jgi:hypothetical protein